MGFFDDPANQPPAVGTTAPPVAAGPDLRAIMNGVGPFDPWTQPVPNSPGFTSPTEAQTLATPGLQYALNEGNRLQQAGAAAKGTLLNARAQQAMNAANIGAALQGYGDLWNREFTANKDQYGRTLGEYLLGRENFQMNQDRPWEKLYQTSQMGRTTS